MVQQSVVRSVSSWCSRVVQLLTCPCYDSHVSLTSACAQAASCGRCSSCQLFSTYVSLGSPEGREEAFSSLAGVGSRPSKRCNDVCVKGWGGSGTWGNALDAEESGGMLLRI